jgi:two-component system, LuxR family, response regulator FixJ
VGRINVYFVGMTDARTCASDESSIRLPARKPMIYVVDDDHGVRTSLRFLLETEGFDVRTFRNGAALLGSATRNHADCLVVDYKMAELDGLELAIRLRRLEVSTPIVLITGFPDESISARANAIGVRHVLLKPNLEDNLIECVQRAIDANAAGQR